MQIKVDISTAGDKSYIRAVDQHSGISIEVNCLTSDAKYFAKCCKKWVKKLIILSNIGTYCVTFTIGENSYYFSNGRLGC